MLFRLLESVELLSNHFWHLFLSRIDGEVKGKAWELEGHQWRREEMSTCWFSSVWTIGEEERAVMEDREKYKYPLPPNGYLSAAVPLSRCGTTAPSKTTWVKELLSWLSWLRCEDVLCKDWVFGCTLLTSCSVPLYSSAFPILNFKRQKNSKLLWVRCRPYL